MFSLPKPFPPHYPPTFMCFMYVFSLKNKTKAIPPKQKS